MFKTFLSTIFDGDMTKHLGVGRSAKDTMALNLYNIPEGEYCYYTLNLLKEGTTRKDVNVLEYRNFMLEFDEGTLQEQLQIIRDNNVPYTALVHSGSKSLHVIISLTEPLDISLEEYKNIHRRLIATVGADPANINPANFTRMPLTMRGDTLQSLIQLKKQVPTNEFLEFVDTLKEVNIRVQGAKLISEYDEFERGALKIQTLDFLAKGDSELSNKDKHYQLLDSVDDLRNQNYSIEEAEHLLVKSAFTLRFPDRIGEVRRAIEDMYRKGNDEEFNKVRIDNVSV